MPVFNYSHSGFWGLAKIFTSDGKHVINSLIQFLIHCQYLYFYFMCSKTGVAVVKSTSCGGVIVKHIELVLFNRHHFFKPMSNNILCISGMTPENIYVICAQAELFQLCQCLFLRPTSFGRAEHRLKLVYYNLPDPG